MKLYGTTSLSMNLIGFLFVLLLGGLQVPLLAQPWHNDGVLITTPQNYQTLHDNAEEYFKKRGTGKGTGYKAYKRWDHYWNSRVNASGMFPPANVRQNEWKKYLAQTPLPQGIGGSSWTSLGPNSSTGGYAGIGRINRVAFHPTDASTFFACTAGGGLWKTSNGGSSWTNLTTTLSRLGTSDLIVDPSNPNVLYLATGDCDGGDTPSIGVLKSTDGGVTWNATGLSFSDAQYVSIYKLILHSTNANILFAATSNGIYKTTNAGQSWTLTLSSSTIYDMAQKSGTPTTYFASSASSVYISTDEGVTWTVRSTITGSGRTSIAITPANPDFVGVLATKSSDYSFLGFYSSTDGGLNYTLRSSTPNILGWESNGSGGSGQGWYDLSLAIDPTNANTIYVGGINTWKSTNGGTSWAINTMWYPETQAVPAVHADKHDLAFQNNSTLFQCNDGGIYKTTNGGSSWTDLSNGMTISQIYRIGVSQLDTKTIAGLQDNGTKLRGTTGTWTDVIGGDGMDCAINPTNASVLYGEYQNGGLQRSTNGGSTWTDIIPENGNASGAWISPIVIDPNNNQTIYFGTNRAVYKSTNQGTAWTKISSTLSLTYDVDNIAVAPSNSSYIYFVTGYYWTKEIYRTTNGGTSWTKMTTPINDRITWLSINPTDPNIIYITYSNYTSGSKVYRSTNGGSTWTNITGTLPNLPANCIVYQTGSNGALYLGMDAGVFYRDNSMSDWSLFNSDLPNVEIFELEIKYNTNKILAATYGRGLWESPLYTTANPALTVSPTTQSVAATAGNFPVTVTSNIAWSVSSNAAWLTASPTSGAGDGSVSASYSANTGAERTGILTFSGSGLTQTVTVTQAAAASLTVAPSNQSVSAAAGSANVTVTANIAWTVSSNAAWLTPSPSSGSNNGTVVASFTANTGAARTGTLTFTGGGITRTATITQAAPPSLSVTPITQSVGTAAGSFSITVSSNIAWTISSDAAWLTTGSSSGSNNSTVTANYAANTDAARTGTLTFSGAGLTQTVTVSQADGRTFWVSPETYAAPASSGSFTFNVNSSSFSSWMVNNNSNWLSVNLSSGFGNGSVTVTYAANAGSTRTGVITISSGLESRTVTITQAANVAPILTISPSSSSVANTAGSFVASVTANVAWTSSSNANWLSISPSSGTGNGSVTLNHSANSGVARSGVVTLSGGGASTTITVTQAAAASLTVTPTSQSVAVNAGNFDITVSSNIAWTVSSNAAWLTPSPSSGSNNGMVTASFTANTGAARTGTLTFTGGGITRTTTITQAAAVANSLVVTPTTQSVGNASGSFSATVASNIAWSVSSNAAWLTINPSSGSGNASVSVNYTANTGTARTGTLTFTGSGITQTVTVNQAEVSNLTVAPTSQSVGASAGSTNVTVTSNVAWTVSSSVAWLTASPTSGSNNGTVTASYTANAGVARTGTLTFTGGGLTSTTTITQDAAAANSLVVTPTTQSVGNAAGSFSATVASNIAWSVSSNAAWLTTSPSSGSGNASVAANYTTNTGATRTGILTFSGSGITQTVTVTQAAAANLTVAPSSQSVSSSAGSANINVTSNVAWTVSSNANWLTPNPSSGSNNGTVTASFTANTGAVRTGTLTFTGGGITRTATITQAAAASLSVTPTTQSVAIAAGSFSITVSSNIAWTISSNAAWLTTSPTSGSNNRTVTASYAANTGAARTGTLTFSGGGLTQTVTVSQADGRAFYVSPETYAAPASTGSFTININTSSFSTWSISSGASWLSTNQFSGFGNGTVTVTHAANAGAIRTGVITISSSFETRTVTVTQATNTAPILSISPSTRSVANAAGSFVASVTANVPWTASSNATWLSMSPNSGTGNGSVSLNHTANTGAERTGVVTLSGGGASTSITVTQAAAASLTVTPTSQSVAANAGNFGITVSANIAWTVSSNANWLSASPTSGSNNGTVTASYTANAGVARTGTLTFSGSGITRTVTVTQAAPTANFLTVSPSSKTIPAGSDTFQVIVRSNIAWTLISSGAWMMPAGNNGSGNATSVIYYQQNQNAVSRIDTLTFSGAGIIQKVVVTQNAGTGSSLGASPSTINANAAASSALINITSNGCWSVSDNASWVLPAAAEGLGNASLSLFIQANTAGARSATVTIDGSGGIQTVVINQAAVASLIAPDLALAPTNPQLDQQAASMIPKMELYPNPAQDVVNIVLDAVDVKQQEIQLVVIDAYGRVVMKQQLNSVFTKISLSNLSNGMYTFSMLLPNAKMLSKKLIVTRTE